MEYERIHKPQQTGLISPSKLRLKLMGSFNQKKKEGAKSNSSTTSPSRLEDSEFVNNSLLDDQIADFGDEVLNLEVPTEKSKCSMHNPFGSDENQLQSKELAPYDKSDTERYKMQLTSKCDSGNSSSVHPIRSYEDENLDYDSTSSFEFHKGERSSLHHSLTRSFSRPVPSKWNDAEKWIMNRHSGQPNVTKKTNLQNRQSVANMVKVAPESANLENRLPGKKVEFSHPTGSVKFGHASNGSIPNAMIDLSTQSKDLKEVATGFPSTKSVTEEVTDTPAIRSVCMRDMGTEMTPIPSQEPSRSVTPVSATTPIRSPNSSLPATPRRGDPAPTPTKHLFKNATTHENCKNGLSEQEMKLKTRREIVALGVQLGKMNIAEWASNEVKEKSVSRNDFEVEELECIENAKRASAWEEAEKSKHAARFKREEIRIQAWESQQKAKLEAEMKKIEVKIDQKKAQAEAQMVKKIALARQKSEEKRRDAEARKSRQAKRTSAQAEYIRETGRIPSSSPFICCGWS